MHSNTAVAWVLVGLAVVGAAGPALSGVQFDAGGADAAQAGPDQAGAGQAGAAASGGQSQPTPAVCDFAELHNRTIQSVVLVRRQRGQGSGFVFRTAGNGTSYVVTNQHVLAGADRVRVKFHRGEVRTGTVVGTSQAADLGVVRVNGTPDYADALRVAGDAPAPGRKVAAFGSPFGLRGTITHGIVSGTDRTVPTDRGFVIPDVLQTDVPINPGNSGGPLVACDGRVVGVNTAGIPAGRAENVGFAVSASLVERVVPALIRTGEFRFAFLGVRTVDVTPAVARANDLPGTRGIMVVETVPDSPAAGALQGADDAVLVDGRRVPVGGDVIVAIEGTPVRSAEDLTSYLATETSPGDRVTLTVIRDGTRRNVTVRLAERPPPTSA